jgi:hypothetical protein
MPGGRCRVRADRFHRRTIGAQARSLRRIVEYIELNSRVLERFSDVERQKIRVHTCPGGDHDSTHSADVDYAGLLPSLFRLNAGRFYIQLASEPDRAVCWPPFEVCSNLDNYYSLVLQTRSTPEWRVPRKCVIGCLKPHNSFPWNRLEQPTTAASRPSPMTRPRRGRRPSQR